MSSSFATTLWQLSYHYFYLSHRSNVVSCACVISGYSYLTCVGASPPHTPPFTTLPLSSADVFNPESHPQTLPNTEWSHSSSPVHTFLASHSWGFFFLSPQTSSSFYFQRHPYHWPRIVSLITRWSEINWLHVKFFCPFIPPC